MTRNVQYLLTVCLLLITSVLIAGCGGDDAASTPTTESGAPASADDGEDPGDSAAPAGSAPAAPMVDNTGDDGEKPQGRKKSDEDEDLADGESDPPPALLTAPAAAGGANTAAQPEAPAGPPPRPENSESWTDADFESAVRDRDSKVNAAIDERVRKLPGDVAVAKLLIQLIAVSLEPPSEKSAAARPTPQSTYDPDDDGEDDERQRQKTLNAAAAVQATNTLLPLDLQSFMEHITGGLIENNTAEGWKAVEQLLSQQMAAPISGDEVCSVTLMALFKRLGSAEAVAGPRIRSLLDGTVTLDAETRMRLLKIVTAVSAAATDEFLGWKANSAVVSGATPPITPGNPLAGRIPNPDDEDGESNLPVQSAAPAAAENPLVVDLDAATLQKAAGFLWSPSVREKFISQFREATDGPAASDLLQLCAAIPHTDARKEIYRRFSEGFEAGTSAWENSGILQGAAHDPGMIVILKSLPRTRPSTKSKSDLQLMNTWTQASYECVLALRDKLKAAATKFPRYDGPSFLRLHKGAVPENSVLIQLPGSLSETMGDSSPALTTIFYTRVTFSPSSAREQGQVAEHYEEKSGGKRRVDEKRGVLWFDGVKSQPGGLRRSVDVIIQRSSAAGVPVGNSRNPDDDGFSGGGGGALGGFLIEIIVVETADLKELPASETDPKADSDSDTPPK